MIDAFTGSVARLTRRVPWLCVPGSHRVCLCFRAVARNAPIIRSGVGVLPSSPTAVDGAGQWREG